MSKNIIQSQFVWFFKEEYLGNFELISLKLQTALGNTKLPPLYPPIPPEMPSEIPRLTLVFNNFNVNFSKNRADVIAPGTISEDVIRAVDKILNDLSLRVGRIGIVKNFFADGDINLLKENLAEKQRSLDLKEITIRINQKITIDDYECNNIEALNIGFLEDRSSHSRRNGIIIMRDINTMPEKISEYFFETTTLGILFRKFNDMSDHFLLFDH